jgi:hypothetical protein
MKTDEKTPNYAAMSSGEMVTQMGVDAKKWTEAFFQIHPTCSVDRETMFGWFCNTIMAGVDNGCGPINGDHAQFLQDQHAAAQ